MTTFCWLPPDSEETFASAEGALTASSFKVARTSLLSRFALINLMFVNFLSARIAAFSRTFSVIARPSCSRSAGKYAERFKSSREVSDCPPTSTMPENDSSPANVFMKSDCPLPTTPETPSISPRRDSTATFLKPVPVKPERRKLTSPGFADFAGNVCSSSLPMIIESNSSSEILETSATPRILPSRKTVTRSAISRTSASRCVM
ncbi:unannotated protein [freshwater metagenome]|uniref:Unannotated protein n=1 Tax=freshwater metagenome TaxID=449393 RepID=A0A6J6DAT7_9ZZZZ